MLTRMSSTSRAALLLALGGLGAGCGDDIEGVSDDPCAGVSGSCIALEAGASQEEVQTALIDVKSGGTVAFSAGRFDLTSDLSLDVDGVTIRGAGRDKTTLSFKGQTTGAQGLLVTGNDFTIQDIGLEDAKGDMLKIEGVDGVTLLRVRAEWTGGPKTENGGYGLYPVQCQNVLIDDSIAIGASDSGIYVGQSDKVIVRNSRAEFNVAGIEIENTTHADVHDNTVTNNTGGILVFNLPGLQVKGGSDTRVFDNEIFENNTDNFAPAGNVVGLVPRGTGIAVLAAHNTEIFNNTIKDHDAVNIGIISYVLIGPSPDPDYDKFPTGLHIHDNTLTGTSDMPTGMLGGLLLSALGELDADGPFIVPDMTWDGVLDPVRVTAGGGSYKAEDKICIHDNGDADFLNLAFPLADAAKPDPSLTPFDCEHPALPEVTL